MVSQIYQLNLLKLAHTNLFGEGWGEHLGWEKTIAWLTKTMAWLTCQVF